MTRPKKFDIIAPTNLNGYYASDKYAGQDKVNPGSVILSGEMMLRYMGWNEAVDLIIKGLEKTIVNKTVTCDFARLLAGAKLLKCSEFGTEIINNM